MGKQKGDQKSPNSAIPICKRMDRLELGVREANMDENWEPALFVQKALEIPECLVHIGYGRWDEGCSLDRRVLGADPILVASELSRRPQGTSTGAQQLRMDLSDKPCRERQRRQPLKAVVHCTDVVDNLLDVTWKPRSSGFEVGGKKIIKGALGALDLGAENCLSPNVHGNKKIGIGNRLHHSVQPAERLIGSRQCRQHLGVELDRWIGRKRLGNEGFVPLGLFNERSGPCC